ncbi:MAG: GNAT family N-acetyltransferase [Bacteroidetes bacterium]|nr:GNAT family N-acetyltransferase [Bacteroidota bacterium]
MEDLRLIELSKKDIPLVSELAHTIWNQHYPSIIGQQQVDYMLKRMYSSESIEEQMEKKGHLFFLIRFNHQPTGFVSVHEEKPGHWFLNKFYIDQRKAATGLGTRAFELLLKKIVPEEITLTVNRKNFKSINFYFKNGFRIEEVKDFDIGQGYLMEDFIMKRKKK